MRKVAVLIFLILLTTPALALRIEDYGVIVDIKDESIHNTIDLDFSTKETKFDLFVLAPVSNLKVIGKSGQTLDCYTEKQTLGDLIVCKDFDEEGLTIDYDMHGLIEKKKNFRIFSYLYVLTRPTDHFNLQVKLPVGSVFADEDKLEGTGLKPFKPLGGIQGTDGRKIYIEWELIDPPLGQTLDVQVIYEPSVELSPSVMAITIVAIIVMLAVFFYMTRKTSTVETMMPVLNPEEKRVANLLMEGEKTQKQIARELDLSKPKVSRLISDMEKRGIVEKRAVGRTNRIRLKESFGESKQESKKEEGKEEEDLSNKFYKKEQ